MLSVCLFGQIRLVIKLFSCLSQLSMKFIMLINVKMPTLVGILTFISLIKTTSESLEAGKVFILQHFSFHEQLNFHAELSNEHEKSFKTSDAVGYTCVLPFPFRQQHAIHRYDWS